MEALFAHPWYMIAGGAMVSSPIIIHLINRIRFKRIRWAAMEFLLKSQKKNRRRLIIEQLILLLLRILLVLLMAFILAQFIGSAIGLTPTSSTTHVVILDDTLSMNDQWKEQNVPKTSFDQSKTQVVELARKAALANSPQHLKVMRLSNKEIIFEERITDSSIIELTKKLDGIKPTYTHVDPVDGIAEAKRLQEANRDGRSWIHYVGDFRERDWGNGPGTEELFTSIKGFTEKGGNVGLIDAAHPDRTETRGVAQNHNNYAITDLKPESRVAPANIPIRFTVEIANMGSLDEKNIFLEVYIDGVLDFRCSKPVEAPKPRTRVRHEFELLFTTPGYNTITARLKDVDMENGLQADNSRNVVLEIRDRVPTLIIDGAGSEGTKFGGDTLAIQTLLTAAKGYQVISRGVDELERPDLAKIYPSIYLLDVPDIKSEKARANLKAYVEGGGNIVYFLGPKISVSHYNKILYEQNKGLFPVPIEDRPTEGLSEEVKQRRRLSLQPQMLIRSSTHPITRTIYQEQGNLSLNTVIISRYYPSSRAKWDPELTRKEQLQELITLPNVSSLDAHKLDAREIMVDLEVNLIKNHEQALTPFKKRMDYWRKTIFEVLEDAKSDETYKLAAVLDQFLADKGEPAPVLKPGEKPDPDKQPLDFTQFWSAPEVKEFKAKVERLRDSVRYGDPLAVVRRYGKGQIVAFMSTASRGAPSAQAKPEDEWNELAGSDAFGIINDLQRYLNSGGDDGSRMLGQNLTFDLDEKLYENKVNIFVQEEVKEKQPGEVAPPVDPNAPKAKKGFVLYGVKKELPTNEGRIQFEFKDATDPKVYYFEFTTKPQKQGDPVLQEERWYSYNVDTEAESNLTRAPKEQLVRNPPGATVERGMIHFFTVSDSFDLLKEKKKNLSETWWLYLVLLVILIVEQALAVHLSHHMRGASAEVGTSGSVPSSLEKVPVAA